MDIEGEESPEERFARLNKEFLREQVYKNATNFLRVESSQEMMYHGVSTKMIFFSFSDSCQPCFFVVRNVIDLFTP